VKAEYCVADVGDVPEGTHIVVEAGGREFGIFNVGGRYYALANVCFHQNGPLCQGVTSGTLEANPESDWQPRWTYDGEIVICPWHRLEFNITTGRCLAFPKRRVPAYEVRIEGQQLWLIT